MSIFVEITLTAAEVRSVLTMLAATRATRTVSMTHTALARAIRHAEASDKVRRNVAALIASPSGRQGRPSGSLTFQQAVALITAAHEYRLYAYVVLSLLVGLRTEEARALRWDHVHLDADSDLPPHVDVWRSVRAHGDVKTSKSRRWARRTSLLHSVGFGEGRRAVANSAAGKYGR